jgi:8-oxo-dGTP pyrophosphatase MutT (NUDIX family)
MSRKIFNYDDLNSSTIVPLGTDLLKIYPNAISACGCLFYKKEDGKSLQLLLISYKDERWPRLDDFGGQIDLTDETVCHTIIRETTEETNGHVGKFTPEMSKLFDNFTKFFYTRTSKYYFALIKVDEEFFSDTKCFGNVEFVDNIERIIEWFNYPTIKEKLAFRLHGNNELLNYLDSL